MAAGYSFAVFISHTIPSYYPALGVFG